ncbi:hypothetical protein [Sphingopyxis sp. BSNA05]|uniref:hypothetical protein n=1 Tax=Sphingopyxis sp. BSNA05 TaxID=1236614 RepID=UPI0020B870FA|nr:hypothetical protein [Sphingopyxis sp. BSNA05]
MGSLLDYISLFGHGIAAALFGALAIWQFQRKVERNNKQIWLIIAITLTSFWALSIAVEGYLSPISRFAETLRNFGWLGFMFILLRAGEGRDEPKTVNGIYAALSFVLVGQILVDSMLPAFSGSPRLENVTLYTSLVLRMIFAVGAWFWCTISIRFRRRKPAGASGCRWPHWPRSGPMISICSQSPI